MLLCHSAVLSQTAITLSEAIELALKHNLEIQKQIALLKKSEQELLRSGRLPNPLFSYSREDLSAAAGENREWSAAGSLPVNFLWERWAGIEASEQSAEAARKMLDQIKAETAARTGSVYAALSIYQLLAGRLDAIYSKVKELTESAKRRLKEGDISEYEMKRILIELGKITAARAGAESEKRRSEYELKLLTGMNSADELITVKPELPAGMISDREELISTALAKRADLAALMMMQASAEAELSYNKMKMIPEIYLSAGYKEQSGGFSGSVFSVDFEIPLFDRNQTALHNTETTLELLQKEIRFTKQKIINEVSEAFDEYQAAESLYKEQSGHDFRPLLATILISYDSGELTLVELTDGLRTCVEGEITNSRLESALAESIYKLVQLSAVTLTHAENEKDKQ